MEMDTPRPARRVTLTSAACLDDGVPHGAPDDRLGVYACPNNATCPFIADAGYDTYLVIGATTTPQHAAEHGGGVGPTETAVLVPKPVIDALSRPLRDRIAELEAERDGEKCPHAEAKELLARLGVAPAEGVEVGE